MLPIRLTRVLAATAVLGLAATAALAEPIIIYSPQGHAHPWITAQAKAAGFEVEFLQAGGGELFDRLMAEKNNPQADVVLGLVDASMAILKSEGMFQAYTPSWAEGLPAQYVDPDAMVHKFWQTPIVLAYNADRMSADQAPKSWLDLIDKQYAGKYVIEGLTGQTVRTYLAGMLVRFLDEKGEVVEEGWDFMRAFYKNGLTGVDKAQAFKSGEAVIDLNWFGGAFRFANDVGFNTVLIDTKGGTPFISEGIAIVAGTDQLEQARAFVDWFGSPEVMAAYAAEFGQMPVHPEAIAKSPKEVQRNATLVSPQDIDWDAIAPKLDRWMQKIELEIR